MTTPAYTLFLLDHIGAGNSSPFRAHLEWDGEPVLRTDLTELLFTLFDRVSGNVINGHYNEDILALLNAGDLEYELDGEADNILLRQDGKLEEHCILLTAKWAGSNRVAMWLIQFVVDPIPLPTAPVTP